MRELTDLEIEQFDFNGKIPELNKPVRRKNAMAVESKDRMMRYRDINIPQNLYIIYCIQKLSCLCNSMKSKVNQ